MFLDVIPQIGTNNVPLAGMRKETAVPKITTMDLNYDQVSHAIAYDPETGDFTWRTSTSKKMKAGDRAGTFKGTRTNRKTGQLTRYMYISLHDYEVPAARVAWLLQTGEWPAGDIRFIDHDPSNLRFGNLREAIFPTHAVERNGKKKHVMSRDAQRHYGLKRYYGMTLAEYGDKLVAQNGVCAVCEKGETAIMHGKVKPLSADHNHESGAIRDLLCSSCNHLIGHAREDRNVLLAAVRYLDKHSAGNVAPIRKQES